MPPSAESGEAAAVGTQNRRGVIAELALLRDMTAETIERMPLGLVALDHAMSTVYANPVALTLIGSSLDSLVGRRAWDLFPAIVGTEHQTVRSSAAITTEYEEHFAATDRWAAVLACPTTTGISIFLRELSEARPGEATVRSSATLLHGSLDAMLDACLVCSARRDAAGAIVTFQVDFANVVAGTYLGGLPDDLIGKPIPEWKINPRDTPFLDACRQVVETGEPWAIDALAYAIAGPEGAATTGTLSLQIARFSDGFFATWRDVTETQRLAGERERLAVIVNEVPDAIVAVDAELRITHANTAFLTLIGRLLLEVVGRNVFELLEGALDAATVARLIEATRSGAPWLGEIERRAADGTAHLIQIRVTPRGTADGRVDGYIAVSRDVTELRAAEQAARENEGRFRSIVEEAAEGIYRTSAEGRVVAANPAMATILGYESPDALMAGVKDVGREIWADPEERARLRRLLDEQGAVQGYECRLVRRDGTRIWVSQHVKVVRGADGHAVFYDGFVEDITERRRLAAERSLLAAAVEQAADFVIVVGRSGMVEAVNPAFERLTGYTAGEMLGRSAASVLRSDVDAPEVYAALDEALRRGEVWSGRLTERRADGSTFQVDLSVSPIRDAAGDLIGSVEIGRDRTRERELEAEHEREAQVKVALATSLAHVATSATLEQAAQVICEVLVTLPFVDIASIQIFLEDDDVQILAQAAPPGYPAIVGTHLPPARGATVRERSAHGPWAQYAENDPDDALRSAAVRSGLKALAYGPIRHADQVVGALVLGTFDDGFAHTIVEQMPGIVSFGTTSTALLGERMYARRAEIRLRDALEAVLAARAFHPVFQPIVDLETSETMGYEALTRFDSGQRPDLAFRDAWRVGLGPDLELATLQAAVTAAKELPSGRWLDLNLSPRLVADGRLRDILWSSDRALVLEVTEHELIDDYDALRVAVRKLGHDIRLAVDDAGAGVANFGHIIDLRPDFVKLDISLVRRVNANLGRQAMVVGMSHFSRTAGCRLIAEGIETEQEATTLGRLGVEFGQGYLFGHPGPVDDWIIAGTAGPGNGGRRA